MNNYNQIFLIANDIIELRKIISWLDSFCFLDGDTKEYFCSDGALTNTLFKKIEKCITINIDKIEKEHVHVPSSICIIIKAIRFDLDSKHKVQESLLNKFINQIDSSFIEIKIENLKNSTTKEIYAISNKNEEPKYLMFFYPILGKKHLPENTPFDCIKVQLFGETVFSNLLGKDKVEISCYPNLNEMCNYSDSIISQFIIQRFLKNYVSLDTFIENKRTRNIGIKNYAFILADIQKSSFGIYKVFSNNLTNSNVTNILKCHKEYISFNNPENYYSWIIDKSWISKKIKGLKVYTSISDVINNNLQTKYLLLARRSCDRLKVGGCLSQLDILPRNILINYKNITKYKLCDFEFVAFSDPAYDLGMALYGIVINAIRGDYTNEINELLKIFIVSYKQNLSNFINPFNETININDYYSDAYRFAGFMLYGVTQSDYKKSYEKYINFAKEISFKFIDNEYKI